MPLCGEAKQQFKGAKDGPQGISVPAVFLNTSSISSSLDFSKRTCATSFLVPKLEFYFERLCN